MANHRERAEQRLFEVLEHVSEKALLGANETEDEELQGLISDFVFELLEAARANTGIRT